MKVLRRRKIIILVTILILVSLVSIDIYLSNNVAFVKKIQIESGKLPKEFNNFKIAHISDLHDKDFGNFNDNIIDKIKHQKPDIIVMTGDMFDSSNSSGEVVKRLFKGLSKIADTYYILGNHEQANYFLLKDKIKSIINDTSVMLCNNLKRVVTKGNKSINIYGLTLPFEYYRYDEDDMKSGFAPNNDILNTLISEADSNRFNILLSHNPLYFKQYADWGADLTLSGHMHGGLIRIPVLGGVLSPYNDFFPKYDAGLFKIKDSYLYVNRGLSAGSIGFRFNNRPEITIIELNKAE